MLRSLLIIIPLAIGCTCTGQILPGFRKSQFSDEQQMYIEDIQPSTRVLINAPLEGFKKGREILLTFYALPNGNTIEQTLGKRTGKKDDWHYNIQHIAAQTRFLREKIKDKTLVVAYVQAGNRSWPAWVTSTSDSLLKINAIVEYITGIFSDWPTEIVLNGHSGGGRFIFSYLNAHDSIDPYIKRIAFLDSNYGYEDTVAGPKIRQWLRTGNDKFLFTAAYNDSVVIYNGKQLVSPQGGTWYRSKMMLRYLAAENSFRKEENRSMIKYTADGGRIEFFLKKNPRGKIFHTVQVERNGFIHSLLNGTALESRGYKYFAKRAYKKYISDTIDMPVRILNIPRRDPNAESGSAFMSRIDTLMREQREEEIYKAVSSGNIPSFLRNSVTLRGSFSDSSGKIHDVILEAMPDYLAVGHDSDFCRIPMNPHTASKIAGTFGASLLTPKLSDFIYERASLKLTPFNYLPVGNANELPSKFAAHNSYIEEQIREAGGRHGELTAGIKKDVVLSERITDRPDRVAIYGWHKPGGIPIQPVYAGHVDWYVDYSHGIRFVNNQVLIDGKPCLLTEVLADPVLYKIFSDEERPIRKTIY